METDRQYFRARTCRVSHAYKMPATAALSRLDRWAQYLRGRYSLPRRPRAPSACFAVIPQPRQCTALLCDGVLGIDLEGTLVAQRRRGPLGGYGRVHARLRRSQRYRAGPAAKRSYCKPLSRWPEPLQSYYYNAQWLQNDYYY